jgi:hypothetical protein
MRVAGHTIANFNISSDITHICSLQQAGTSLQKKVVMGMCIWMRWEGKCARVHYAVSVLGRYTVMSCTDTTAMGHFNQRHDTACLNNETLKDNRKHTSIAS